jgi:membrane-associated protein
MELITGLLDLVLHLDTHLDQLAGQFGNWTYLILFLIIFAESGIILTPFLPGDALLFALGALTATTEHFNLFLILVLLTAAALLGYFFNYWLGASIGKTLFKNPNSKIFRRKYIDKTHAFYERYGAKTILFARYLPIIRTFAPFVAGMATMRFSKFVLYTVIGGVVWVLLVVLAGHFFGGLPYVQHNFSVVILGIIFVSLVPTGIEIIKGYLESGVSPLQLVINVTVWFAGIGERVLMWSLRHWVLFVAPPCVGLVLLTKWIAFTLSKRIIGLDLPLFGVVPQRLHHTLISYGAGAGVLILLAALIYSRRGWRMLAWVGALMLLVALFAVLQVAFLRASLLYDLLGEEAQAKIAGQFNHYYLPLNSGTEESNVLGLAGLPTETVWYRLLSACYFMGFGWYVTVIGGLCAFFCGLYRAPGWGSRAFIFVGACGSAVLVTGLCSAGPLLAHVAAVQAQEAESRGDRAAAIQKYREAIRLDDWYAIQPDLYLRIGAIDFAAGRLNTVEYGMYRAELLLGENNFPAAIGEYQKLTGMAGAPQELIKRQIYEIWTNYGLRLYADGAIGSAITAWQNVLALDPDHWLAISCLSTAYFNSGRYQESIDLIERLLQEVADPGLRADLNSNLGDAYTRLGEYEKAKLAYRVSYTLDNILNWRALMSLVGY